VLLSHLTALVLHLTTFLMSLLVDPQQRVVAAVSTVAPLRWKIFVVHIKQQVLTLARFPRPLAAKLAVLAAPALKKQLLMLLNPKPSLKQSLV